MEKVQHVNPIKLGVRQLRQRMFVKRSNVLFGSKYTFIDDIPEQIEALEGFTNWETFSEEWDLLWYGLDPRYNTWVPGRHHSPMRQLAEPLLIVKLDDRTKRMEVPHYARQAESKLPVINIHFKEEEVDRVVSESLSGRMVIDEPDEEKAARMIEETMKDLQNKLALIKGIKK